MPIAEGSSIRSANDSGAGKKFCWVTTIGERFPHARIMTYRYNGTPEDVIAGLMEDLVNDRKAAKNKVQHNVCFVSIHESKFRKGHH
jgi:hypothetical protein